MEDLVSESNQIEDLRVHVEAHTDIDGSVEYNIDLSKRRSMSVSNFLEDLGIDSSVIEMSWFGEQQPKVLRNDDLAKQENRRVLVSFYSGTYSDWMLSKKTSLKFSNAAAESLKWLKKAEEGRRQVIRIDPSKAYVIDGGEGTRVEIPAACFVLENGQRPEGPVTLELIEALEPVD